MGVFSEKLSKEQKDETREYAVKIIESCRPYLYTFSNKHSDCVDLYQICKQALQKDQRPSGVDDLIKKAMNALKEMHKALSDAHAQMLTLRPPQGWYPKVLREAPETVFNTYFSGSQSFLEMAMRALEQPDPLIHDPVHGNDKLNMFVSGLNTVAFFSQGLIKYVLSPIEDWLSKQQRI
jgi:hypothetical protein